MRKTILIASMLALGGAAIAHSASPQQIVEARQGKLKEMGKAMKAAADSFKSGAPDAKVIRASAALIADHAPQLPSWFPAGTAAGGALKTSAKPEIWSDHAGFTKAAADLAAAAKNFQTVAAGNDFGATAKAMGALGGTCKGCHEKFKAKD